MTQRWYVPRESKEWVGPFTITITVNNVVVSVDPANVRFAVLPVNSRPTVTDWIAPVTEPGGSGIGVQADPVASPVTYGIWIQITDSGEIPVLDPTTVGYLYRT